MTPARNPFRIQAAQHAVTDDAFVRLFAPGALDLLSDNDLLWERLIVLRSAPGGGKTSLFRLFTPGPLRTACSLRSHESFKETYQYLRKLGALGENGPDVLAIMLAFSSDYRTLDELHASPARNDRVFCALLNARLVLSALRTITEGANLVYPRDLEQIRVAVPAVSISALPSDASGQELYRWASDIEEAVFDALDSLGDETLTGTPGHDAIFALNWFAEATFRHGEAVVPGKRLVMLDDVHNLAPRQRRLLLDRLAEFRRPLGLWISERLEALQPDDLLSLGARQGRDYAAEIELESKWRQAKGARFQKFVAKIADLRAEQATGFESRAFTPYLAATLEGPAWQGRFVEAQQSIQTRVERLAAEHPRYRAWLAERLALDQPPQLRAIAWRCLEILIERDKRKAQGVLDFDVLTAEELDDREGSGVRAAAEFFLSQELKTPYYFGMDRLVMLASSNVEQFIDFAGDLFEEIVSEAIIRRQPIPLSPERQEEILQAAVEARWRTIPQGTSNGYQASRLLEAVGAFCVQETLQPNAPYAPGVTGIAISMEDRRRLVVATEEAADSKLGQLAATLGACVAQNLLEVRMDMKNKGQHWLLLYLNRMLCLKFRLPLGYGGWRPKKVGDLIAWMDRGAEVATKSQIV